MKRFPLLLTVAAFAVLIVLFTGWYALDWQTIATLPWMFSLLLLAVTSLAWTLSFSKPARLVSAGLTGLAFLLGILLLSGIVEFAGLWVPFTVTGLAAAVTYLCDLARSSTLYKGAFAYVLLLPVALVAYAVIALLGWNGGLTPAWIGLLLLVVFAVVGLFGKRV